MPNLKKDDLPLDTSAFPEEVASEIKGQIRGVPLWYPVETAKFGDYVIDLKVSPDGERVAVALGSGTVQVLNHDLKPMTSIWTAHTHGILSLTWLQDSRRLATGGQDGKQGKIKVWQTDENGSSPTLLWEALGGSYTIESLQLSPDNAAISSSSGKFLKLWNPEDGRLIQEFETSPATISGMVFRGSHERLATCSYGGVWLWDVAQSAPKRHFAWKGSPLSLALSPDGKWIASGCQDSSVHVWRTTNGKDLEMSGYPLKVKALAWSQDSKFLATSGGAEVTIWDFSGKGPSGSTPKVKPGHVESIESLAFHPNDPSLLLSIGKEGALFLWNVTEQQKPLRLGLMGADGSALQWFPDGKQCLTGSASGDVWLWNAGR